MTDRPVLELTPYEPPERGAGSFGKPDEDAWNRYAAQYVKLRRHAHRLERAAVLRNTEKGFLATPGYDDPHVAFREATDAIERWEGRQAARADRELAELRAQPAAAGGALILTARKSAESCQPKNVLVRCGCGGGQARLVQGGCERTNCVRCAPSVTKDRARRVREKLLATMDAMRVAVKQKRGTAPDQALFSFRVSVLTMPPSEREKYLRAKDWTALRRKVWHMFRDEFGAAWACVATHPVGDEDPSVFHPHLNVLWGKAGLAPGKMSPEELERLKRRWAELLGVEGPVDVHGSFVKRNDAKRVAHRARYYCRVFVGWKFWLPKAVQWFGEYVRGLAPGCVCPECGQSFAIMAMGDEAVQLYLRLVHLAQQRGEGPPSPAVERSPLFDASGPASA